MTMEDDNGDDDGESENTVDDDEIISTFRRNLKMGSQLD